MKSLCWINGVKTTFSVFIEDTQSWFLRMTVGFNLNWVKLTAFQTFNLSSRSKWQLKSLTHRFFQLLKQVYEKRIVIWSLTNYKMNLYRPPKTQKKWHLHSNLVRRLMSGCTSHIFREIYKFPRAQFRRKWLTMFKAK